MVEVEKNLPFVTVMVCTIGKSPILEETIKSLLKQNYPADRYEILVVIDEDVNTFKKIKKYPVRVVFREKRAGLASARNLCLKCAKGEIIAFTDDDCIVDENWLRELVRVFNDEEIKGVGGIVRPLNFDPISKAITLLELVGIAALNKEEDAGIFHRRIAGINSAYRKTVIKEVGGWDENIFYGGDDVDFNYMLLKKNYKLRVTPNAVVYHNHRQTLRELFWWSYKLAIGYTYVIKKHRIYVRSLLISLPIILLLSFLTLEVLMFIRYGIFASISLLFLFILIYFGWLLRKSKIIRINLDIKTIFYTPLVVLVFSIGGIIGRLRGFLKGNV